jgi:hypothetical protein
MTGWLFFLGGEAKDPRRDFSDLASPSSTEYNNTVTCSPLLTKSSSPCIRQCECQLSLSELILTQLPL